MTTVKEEMVGPVTVATNDGNDDAEGGRMNSPKYLNRRENLRAKLRQSEARLLNLTRSEEATGGIFGQMVAVTSDLKKMEEERSLLETELGQLQSKTNEQNDVFLKDKMAAIQDGFQKQVEMIRGLQEELSIQDDEITFLRQDLVQKLRRIVELQFDLEMHSIHFTNYAQEQFKLGEEALAELKERRGGRGGVHLRDSMTESSSSNVLGMLNSSGRSISSNIPHDDASSYQSLTTSTTTTMNTKKEGGGGSSRKAQKLIYKLLTDLDHMESRYKADRLHAASELYKAQMTMDQLRTRIQVLEQQEQQQQQQLDTNSPDAERGDDDSSGVTDENKKNNNNVGEEKAESTMATTTTSTTTTTTALFMGRMMEEDLAVQVLRTRNETLEARLFLSQQETDRLKSELDINQNKVQELEMQHESIVDRLQLENMTLRARIQDLQGPQQEQSPPPPQQQQQDHQPKRRGMGLLRKKGVSSRRWSSSSSNNNNNNKGPLTTETPPTPLSSSSFLPLPLQESPSNTQYYKAIQDEVETCVQKITCLEADRSLRDTQISSLKKEILSLRMREIANGRNDAYSNDDAKLLRSTVIENKFVNHHHNNYYNRLKQEEHKHEKGGKGTFAGAAGGDDRDVELYIQDLQQQLHHTKEQLAKKDQELVMERAQSASTAAGLLARITATTQNPQLQTPLQQQEQQRQEKLQPFFDDDDEVVDRERFYF